MPTRQHDGRKLDARPDRPDIRDRLYLPPLKRLPPQYPPPQWVDSYLNEYCRRGLVLNQGREGACTGFGLAALINYLQFRHFKEQQRANSKRAKSQRAGALNLQRVSARMLYHLARRYDEWPGEDYSGSSCRGAMKGWFHHGVCSEKLWPYEDKNHHFVEPKSSWASDAASRPLGAYYRIATESISDVQAAINEVGAVYASGDVHDGWWLKKSKRLPVIKYHEDIRGGHAFALVGYTREGFILQNSWGSEWGYRGFAVLTYDDWLKNAGDAWVATFGAPVAGEAPAVMLSSERTVPTNTPWHSRGLSNGITAESVATSPSDQLWSTAKVLNRALVLGNDGLPNQLIVDVENPAKAVERVCYTNPRKFFQKFGTPPRFMIYAHGGLNDLNAALARIKVLGPLFEGNGIYPLFVCWQTGYLGSVVNILQDWVKSAAAQAPTAKARSLMETLSDARDYALEAFAVPIARPVWSQMKQNGSAASETGGGTALLVQHLAKLKDEFGSLELHLVGHSAGAIVHGGLLTALGKEGVKANSLRLFAPACTIDFATKHYLPAIKNNTVAKANISFDILSDDVERADIVGPYGKSLLYLISRALERKHKTAILGMEAAWDPALAKENDVFNEEGLKEAADWAKAWGNPGKTLRILSAPAVAISADKTIKAAHGCFDNWLDCVTRSICGCLGLTKAEQLPFPVKEIADF
jgi:hypothetical protein